MRVLLRPALPLFLLLIAAHLHQEVESRISSFRLRPRGGRMVRIRRKAPFSPFMMHRSGVIDVGSPRMPTTKAAALDVPATIERLSRMRDAWMRADAEASELRERLAGVQQLLQATEADIDALAKELDFKEQGAKSLHEEAVGMAAEAAAAATDLSLPFQLRLSLAQLQEELGMAAGSAQHFIQRAATEQELMGKLQDWAPGQGEEMPQRNEVHMQRLILGRSPSEAAASTEKQRFWQRRWSWPLAAVAAASAATAAALQAVMWFRMMRWSLKGLAIIVSNAIAFA